MQQLNPPVIKKPVTLLLFDRWTQECLEVMVRIIAHDREKKIAPKETIKTICRYFSISSEDTAAVAKVTNFVYRNRSKPC